MGEIADLMEKAKSRFDVMMSQMKLIMVECLLSADRETLSGPDYLPCEGWEKWGYQRGSVYVGGERVPVQKLRLRKNGKEKGLPIYESLRDKKRFSEEIFQKTLMGISSRDYEAAMEGLLGEFGISRSTVSRSVVTVSANRLKEL